MSVIIGAKDTGQLDDNLAATELKLTDEELETPGRGQRAAARISGLDARTPERQPNP